MIIIIDTNKYSRRIVSKDVPTISEIEKANNLYEACIEDVLRYVNPVKIPYES